MTRQADQAVDRHDIQALVGTGFGWLTESRFWLLTVRDPVSARRWLEQLLSSGLVHSVDQMATARRSAAGKVNESVAVGFTYQGLVRLGIAETDEAPFPTPFRSGLGSPLRGRLLLDGSRDGWDWKDVDNPARPDAVHVMVAQWWRHGQMPSMPVPGAPGFECRTVDGCHSFFRNDALYEPFGFRDGISQPSLIGLREVTTAPVSGASSGSSGQGENPYVEDHRLALGEVVLGYPNEYGQTSNCPDVAGWGSRAGARGNGTSRFGRNGTFLAVRQIEQDVDAFRRLHPDIPASAGCPATPSDAEKLMGRRRDLHGTPLSWADIGCPMSDEQANAFRYRVLDGAGFNVPIGSHIRRANPRDMFGDDPESGIRSSKLHRLLRRGRPYKWVDGNLVRQGLMFIACNADLERQYEFVQGRWLNNLTFAGLSSESDPLVGGPPAQMTVQGLPAGRTLTLSQYTQTLGGGYFFLPGIRALKFVAAGGTKPQKCL